MNLIAGKTVSIDFESRYKDVLVVPSSITETVVVASGIDTAIPVAATPSTVGVTFLGFVVPADSEPGTKFFVRMTAIVGGVELSTTKPVGIVGVDIEARLTAQDACLEEIKGVAGSGLGTVTLPDASDVAAGVDRGDGVLGTATNLASNLPPSSDVRLGVNRGDGVLGTLQDFSEPNLEASTLEFIQFDDYDGVCNPRKAWATKQDLTGKTITLIVFHKHDHSNVVGRFTGVVDSPTQVSVEASDVFGNVDLEFCGCPPVAELAFVLVAELGNSQTTIEQGRAFVFSRPTVSL